MNIKVILKIIIIPYHFSDLNRVIEERGRSLRQLENSFRPLDCTTSAMNRSMRARNMMLGMLTPRKDPKKNPPNEGNTTLDLKLANSPLSSSTPFLAGSKGLFRTNNSSRSMRYDPGAMNSSLNTSLTSECKEQFNLTLEDSRIHTPLSSSTPFVADSKGLSRTNNSSRVMISGSGGMDSSLNMSLSSRRKEQFMLKMLTPQKSKQSFVDCKIPKISLKENSDSTLDLRAPIASDVSSKLNTSVNMSNRSLMFAKRFLCKKNQADLKPEPESSGSCSTSLDKVQCSAPLPEKVADVTSKNPTCEDPVVAQVKKECRSQSPSPVPLPSRKRKKSSPPVKSEPPSAPMSRLGTAKELDIELKKLSASHPHLRDLINMSPMKQIFDLDDRHVMPSPSKRHRFEEKDFLSSTRIGDVTGSLQNVPGPSTASAHQVESPYPAHGGHQPTNMSDSRSSSSTRYHPEEPLQTGHHNDRQGNRPADHHADPHADGYRERGPYPPPPHSPHPNRPPPHGPPPHGPPPHGPPPHRASPHRPPPDFHGPPPSHLHPSYSDYHRPNHRPSHGYDPPTSYHGYPGYNRYDRNYPPYDDYDRNGYGKHYQEHRGDPYGRRDYNNRHPQDRDYYRSRDSDSPRYPEQVKIVNTFSPYHGQPLPTTENRIIPHGSGENQQPNQNNIPTLGVARSTGNNNIDSLQAPFLNNIIDKLNEKGSKMKICLKYDLEIVDEDKDDQDQEKENTKKKKKKK